jgi:hypothetical protein
VTLTADARVPTDRASRYLVQLCQHLDQMGNQHAHGRGARTHGEPPQVPQVEYTDDHGVITFADGRCTIDATPDALALRVEAPDAESLQNIQAGLAHRLETIGRRDKLTVTW